MTDAALPVGARCGALAPDFALSDIAQPEDAPPVRLRSIRQRSPAVLLLLPSLGAAQNERWLRAVRDRAVDLEYYQAKIFAVAGPEDARRLLGAVDVTFPVLADENGNALRAYLGPEATLPALAVIDRYSQLVTVLRAKSPEDTPDLDAVTRELQFADQQDCACTLPAWEP
ncbi:MAG TPA: redoxin domain-containing protein [Ktedonobacterales bacterium]